jgi:hypothetical protein
MCIIGAVTTKARCWKDDFAIRLCPVAAVAIGILVGTGQWISGLLGMIKAPPFPTTRIVASRASGPKLAFMAYILVTGIAGLRRLFVSLRSMTLLTWHCRMLPD